jgi:hypothetical protein
VISPTKLDYTLPLFEPSDLELTMMNNGYVEQIGLNMFYLFKYFNILKTKKKFFFFFGI